MPPLLSIIMVSYNSEEHILRSIGSIYAQTRRHPFEIIVVDNASEDNSIEKTRQNFPYVRIIQSDRNLGFAGGVRLGTAKAKGEYLLLVNPDTFVVNSAIDKLMDFAHQNPGNGIWSGVTLHEDMSMNPEHAWTKPTFFALLCFAFGLNKYLPSSPIFNKINYGGWRRDTIKDVDIVSGCFFLTTRKLWDRLNGFDPAFFLYAEEADFCLRAKNIGYRPIVTPEATVIHQGGASHSNFSGKMTLLLKGKVELIHRHVDTWKQPVYKSLLWLYVFNNNLIYLLTNPRSEKQREWNVVLQKQKFWLKGYR